MDYYGKPVGVLENATLRLEYLLDAGPRIVRLVDKQLGKNLFVELPYAALDTPLGKYNLLGGHRLWAAPESVEFTYILDKHGVQVKKQAEIVILSKSGDAPGYIYKEMRIELEPDRPIVHIMHSLRNDSVKSVDCAPWSITMFPSGGTAYMPLLRKDSTGTGLLPDRNLVFWPYADLHDPRLVLENNLAAIQVDSTEKPFKIGARSPRGWLAYQNGPSVFIKRSFFDVHARYPDMGCNAEIYTNGKFVELEFLNGLSVLEPGEWVDLEEEWEVRQWHDDAKSLASQLMVDEQ